MIRGGTLVCDALVTVEMSTPSIPSASSLHHCSNLISSFEQDNINSSDVS